MIMTPLSGIMHMYITILDKKKLVYLAPRDKLCTKDDQLDI